MMSREEAIKAFMADNDLEHKLQQVFAIVMERKPNALLVFWEDDDGYGAVTLPHSRALAYGLVNKAFDMLVGEPDDVDDGDDGAN